MRTRIMAGLGIAALLLAGCSGGGSQDDGDGPVEVTFSAYFLSGPPVDYFLNIVEDYNNSQDKYVVKTQDLAFAGYHETIFTQIGAGEGPTIATTWGGEVRRAVESGIAQDLTGKVDVGDSPSLIEQSLEVDGKRYAVDFGRSPQQLLINTTLLKEQGLEVPTTYDEFLDVAEKLTDAPNSYGFAFRHTTDDPNGMWADVTNWTHGSGASWVTDGKPTIDTPEMAEGIRRMKTFLDEDLIPRGTDAPTYRRLFWEGKVAMLIDSIAFSSIFAAQSDDLAEGLAVLPLPMENQEFISTYDALIVNKNASDAKKEGAYDFLNHMLSPEIQNEMVENMGGYLPSSLVEFSDDMLAKAPWLADWNSTDSGRTVFPDGVIFSEIRDVVEAQLELIFNDKISIEDGLAQAQKDAEALFS